MRDGRLDRAGQLQYEEIPALERLLEKAEDDQADGMKEEAVTEKHIASVVSRWTGIPVDKMLEGEREKLLGMEDIMRKRVVGQDLWLINSRRCRR